MTGPDFRIEHDGMGELRVPSQALWGAQTQRAVDNFPISGQRMPRQFLRALGLIKGAAATANAQLSLLDEVRARAIVDAAHEVALGTHDAHFPIDVFQTGSGTSSNMNANEVIARLAMQRCNVPVHANDHVNLSQSSNDVIPSCIHVAAMLGLRESLLPTLARLAQTIAAREPALQQTVTTGRTHLMDAMPITLAQELSGWRMQIENAHARLVSVEPRLLRLGLGGTAVGTGVNAHPLFAHSVSRELQRMTQIDFAVSPNFFESLSSQDAAVELSGQLKVLAVSLMKICNDLRWMNSGPLAGLGEISLPALQPGSSIMPGKVNPVIPEAVAMVAAQVIGNDAAITIGGQSGNFQLNVMLPLIANNLLQSITLLANGSNLLADRAIAHFTVNAARLNESLRSNPVLVTALNPLLGYERGAAIAKQAYAQGRPILDVARELSGLSDAELAKLLDPLKLTLGGGEGGEGHGA